MAEGATNADRLLGHAVHALANGRKQDAEHARRALADAPGAQEQALLLAGWLARAAAAGQAGGAIPADPAFAREVVDACLGRGLRDAAIAVLRVCLLRQPADQSTRLDLVNLLLAEGCPLDAAVEVQTLRLLAPDNPGYVRGAADVLAALGQHVARREALEQLYALNRDPGVLVELMQSAAEGGDADAALAYAARAGESGELPAEACMQIGNVWFDAGAWQQALDMYARVLAAHPGNAGAHNNAGNAAKQLGRLDEAEYHYREALADPTSGALPYVNLADLYTTYGFSGEAVACFTSAIEAGSTHRDVLSGLAVTSNYVSDLSAASIFDMHCRAGAAYRAAEPHAWPPVAARGAIAGGRLRIGFVSGDFRRHSVAFFLLPLLRHIDRSRFQVHCYSNVRKADQLTAEFEALADHWHDIAQLDDGAASQRVHADGLDLLVDLAGHSSLHRLGIFGYRPAPVQATWLGYPNTSGLDCIDYRLVDDLADPPGGSGEKYTESLYRLDGAFLCYEPPAYRPPLQDAPVTGNGYVTFGSCNSYAKYSDATVRVWSDILVALPGARLALKSGHFRHARVRRHALERFAAAGVDSERIRLSGFADSIEEHLDFYAGVDIALDTIPYNGTTTTFEALWSGVPVVTCCGGVHRSRVSGDILQRLGHAELVAPDGGLRDLAVALAADVGSIQRLRGSVYAALPRSGLTDGVRFAARMERAFLDMVEGHRG